MTDTFGPSWVISYKPPEPGREMKTLTIPAESMVSAIKAAQMRLAKMDGGPFRIVLVALAAGEPDAPISVETDEAAP